jgi:phage tail sheath protein FI
MSETFLHGVQVLEVDSGDRPIRTVRSSVIGLVGHSELDGVAASVTIGTGNSALKFTQSNNGDFGNEYSIVTVNPGTNNAALAITLNATTKVITISLATDGSGVATSTASQVLAAFNANNVDNQVRAAGFTCALASGSSGAGLFAVHTAAAFVGGVDDSFPYNTPVLVTSPVGLSTKLSEDSYLLKALTAIYKQAGAVVVVVNSDDPVGDPTTLTGAYALKRAQSVVGYVPRILVCEGAGSAVDVNESLKSVADSCRAVAVVGIAADIATDATSWITDNANERVYGLWPFVNGGEDPAPYVAGVIAKSDNDRGFWWSPSNQEVFGITSLDSPVDFQLGDSTSLANVLNEGKVTTFIRQGGFRVWGNLTGSIDPKWQFLSVRRTADIINDSILFNHLWAVDRNITRTYLEDVADGVNNYLADLTNLGAVIGGRCWPDPGLNSPSQIALGNVYFNFEFTPPYPAQTVTFRSILTNDYLSELID